MTSDRDEIQAIEEAWPEALARRDGDWLAQHTSADLLFVEPDGSVLTRDEYVQARVESPQQVEFGENRVEQMRLFAESAVVINRARFRTRVGQDCFEYEVVGTGLYLKEGGRWRLAAAQVSPVMRNWLEQFRLNERE